VTGLSPTAQGGGDDAEASRRAAQLAPMAAIEGVTVDEHDYGTVADIFVGMVTTKRPLWPRVPGLKVAQEAAVTSPWLPPGGSGRWAGTRRGRRWRIPADASGS